MRRFLFFLTIFASLEVFAQKRTLLYFGAGGEPSGEKTIFDKGFEDMMKSLPSHWERRVLYDGDHSKSRQLANELTKNRNKNFTKADYNQEIQRLINEIKTGKLKAGDQILVNFDTHGSRPVNGRRSISAIDGEVSTEKIKELRDLAEKKNVKMAIIDMACFAGNSLNLATSKTCVIAGATADSLAFSPDAEELYRALESSNNLEEAFLKARKDPYSLSAAQPQISTPAGKALHDLMKPLDFANQELRDLRTNEYCDDPTGVNKAKAQLKKIQNFSKLIQPQEIKSLENQIDTYVKNRNGVVEAISLLNKMEQDEQCQTIRGQEWCLKFKNFNYQYYKNHYAAQLKKCDSQKDKGCRESYTIALQLVEEMKQSPKHQKIQAQQGEIKKARNKLYNEITSIQATERAIYDKLYREISASSKQDNACKDFKLTP